jgi:hypothetical protein
VAVFFVAMFFVAMFFVATLLVTDMQQLSAALSNIPARSAGPYIHVGQA